MLHISLCWLIWRVFFYSVSLVAVDAIQSTKVRNRRSVLHHDFVSFPRPTSLQRHSTTFSSQSLQSPASAPPSTLPTPSRPSQPLAKVHIPLPLSNNSPCRVAPGPVFFGRQISNPKCLYRSSCSRGTSQGASSECQFPRRRTAEEGALFAGRGETRSERAVLWGGARHACTRRRSLRTPGELCLNAHRAYSVSRRSPSGEALDVGTQVGEVMLDDGA